VNRRLRLFLPLAVFAVMAAFLYQGFLLNDPHDLPSALIDKPFPEFRLPSLGEERVLTREDLIGHVTLVNVWATWCPTCAAEHEALKRIAREHGMRIVGVNYKDDLAKAKRWLRELGNPYVMNVVDADGRLGIDLGVYGAPESFLVDAQGVIRYKRVGEVNAAIWARDIAPLVERLTAEAEG
jgi:cytochrome c biogenesis protein CcmG/thiol:disulfide interchange protein DsbE